MEDTAEMTAVEGAEDDAGPDPAAPLPADSASDSRPPPPPVDGLAENDRRAIGDSVVGGAAGDGGPPGP